MEDSGADRRHLPTDQHRKQAWESGNVPVSRDLNAIVSVLGAIGLLAIIGPMIWFRMAEFARENWSGQIEVATDAAAVSDYLTGMVYSVGMLILALLCGITLVTAFAHLMQTRFGIFTGRVSIDIGRVNPGAGMSRLISMSSVFGGFATVLKIVAVLGVFCICIWIERDRLVDLMLEPSEQSRPAGSGLVFAILAKVGLGLVAVALIDLMFQRWHHEQGLKMTDDELRDQWRAVEGDPQTNRRRNELRQQFQHSSILPDMNRSEILLFGSSGVAIGLKSNRDNPHQKWQVTVKGQRDLALRMRGIAEGMQLRTIQSDILVEKIFRMVDAGQPVPVELEPSIQAVVGHS